MLMGEVGDEPSPVGGSVGTDCPPHVAVISRAAKERARSTRIQMAILSNISHARDARNGALAEAIPLGKTNLSEVITNRSLKSSQKLTSRDVL